MNEETEKLKAERTKIRLMLQNIMHARHCECCDDTLDAIYFIIHNILGRDS